MGITGGINIMGKILKIVTLVSLCFTFLSCNPIRKANDALATFDNDLKESWLRQDAGKRLADYEWFYDQYGVIKATKTKVLLAKEPEKTAIKMVLTDMVEDYNSKSRMKHTKAMWKPQDLPYQINITELLGE